MTQQQTPSHGSSWVPALRSLIRGEVFEHHPLASFTTIQAGGCADCLVHPNDPSDLSRLYAFAKKETIPITILGKGSNILIADEGIRGIVLRLVGPYFMKCEVMPESQVLVGAGVLKSDLLQFSIDHDLAGLEFSSGIPGDIGGALRMNAGTKYGSYADCLVEAEVFRPETGAVETIRDAATKSAYRHQSYIRDGIVTQARFQLKPGKGVDIAAERDRIIAERTAKQPLDFPNFGSTFKNPDHPISAGRMIEQAQLKGTRFGDAEVSTKHANFIVNRGGATATDIVKLICHMQQRVYDVFQVWLEPEVCLVGQHPLLPPKTPPHSAVVNTSERDIL